MLFSNPTFRLDKRSDVTIFGNRHLNQESIDAHTAEDKKISKGVDSLQILSNLKKRENLSLRLPVQDWC